MLSAFFIRTLPKQHSVLLRTCTNICNNSKQTTTNVYSNIFYQSKSICNISQVSTIVNKKINNKLIIKKATSASFINSSTSIQINSNNYVTSSTATTATKNLIDEANNKTLNNINTKINDEDKKNSNNNNSNSDDGQPRSAIMQQLHIYGQLTKWKLGLLVLATTAGGFAISPFAMNFPLFMHTIGGTALTIGCANTFNQLLEINNDRMMFRTRKRPLPQNLMSKFHATTFGLLSGSIGVGWLYYFVNPFASYLALFNIALYVGVYTPMKQKRPLNTYVGAIVGAIPPAIGWVAATNGIIGSAGAGLVLPAILAFWQIPHFMSLSWSLKDDYKRGGFKMRINEEEGRRIVPLEVLLGSVALSATTALSPFTAVASPLFAITATTANLYYNWSCWQFYKNPTREKARSVFKESLLLLPLLMGLMIAMHTTEDDLLAQQQQLQQ